MSCIHEALRSYTRPRGSHGPTRTATAQRTFAERLRGALARINARIREAAEEGDAFDLNAEALADDVPDEVFNTGSRQAAVSGFLAWLRDQLDEEFLGVVGPDRNEFIRQAYATGIRNAHRDLSDLDVAFERPDVNDLLSRPVHRSALQTLYTRTYENLKSLRDDVAQTVRDTLLEGFREGRNPRDIARSLTDRVDSIGKHRATLIARSEVMNAHSEATLNRADEISEEADTTITARHGEWADSRDTRVCPFCRRLDGTELTTNEMRTTGVEFRGQAYRLKPPAHPNGRCRIKLRLGGAPTTPLRKRLDGDISLL